MTNNQFWVLINGYTFKIFVGNFFKLLGEKAHR
jgi:hypothetical protein